MLPHALEATAEDSTQVRQQGNNEYENADFFVELKRGEVYSFLACTPDFVKCYMEREGEHSFVSPGLLLVREISEASILSAIEACLEDGELERVGVLQSEDGLSANRGELLGIAH